jgi:lysozyme
MAATLGTNGTGLIHSFETCRLVAYPDQGGVATIGWGHVAGVSLGDTCTQAQADAWFVQDAQVAVDAVNKDVPGSVTQNQFDALCSLCFNIGAGAFAGSTLVKRLNAGDVAGAAAQFPAWNHVNGAVNAGLTRRRAAEQALFLQG